MQDAASRLPPKPSNVVFLIIRKKHIKAQNSCVCEIQIENISVLNK